MISYLNLHLLLFGVCLSCSGCSYPNALRGMLTLAGAGVRHVDGTWVGRIKQVKMYDRGAGEVAAAVLEIEKGPSLREEYPGQFASIEGAGRVPVLARNGEDPVLIPPEDSPIEKRVEVSGTIFLSLVRPPSGPGGGTPSSVSRIRSERSVDELVLILRDKPRVLGE